MNKGNTISRANQHVLCATKRLGAEPAGWCATCSSHAASNFSAIIKCSSASAAFPPRATLAGRRPTTVEASTPSAPASNLRWPIPNIKIYASTVLDFNIYCYQSSSDAIGQTRIGLPTLGGCHQRGGAGFAARVLDRPNRTFASLRGAEHNASD